MYKDAPSERLQEAHTMWVNKKPAEIAGRAEDFFSLNVSSVKDQALANRDGGRQVVHQAFGNMDVVDHGSMTVLKTTITGIQPTLLQFMEEKFYDKTKYYCLVSLGDGNEMFREVMEQIYFVLQKQVEEWVVGNESFSFETFDMDVVPSINDQGILKLGVTETMMSQNIQNDTVLSDNKYRNISLFAACAWIRVIPEGNHARIRVGIKWDLAMRPKRKATTRVVRSISFAEDDEDKKVLAVDEEPKKKRRRKRKDDEEKEN